MMTSEPGAAGDAVGSPCCFLGFPQRVHAEYFNGINLEHRYWVTRKINYYRLINPNQMRRTSEPMCLSVVDGPQGRPCSGDEAGSRGLH